MFDLIRETSFLLVHCIHSMNKLVLISDANKIKFIPDMEV